MDDLIFENIVKLQTPVGFFNVMSGNDIIPFFVKRNGLDFPLELMDENNNVIGIISTETNYCMMIDVNRLQIGEDYTVRFFADTDCKWEHCDSDDYTTCYNTIIDEWVVGIGAFDPNSQEKDDQAWEYSEKMGFLKENFLQNTPAFDETNFVQYIVEALDTRDGFRFRIFDYSREKIYFEVAWIKIEEYPSINYEDALGLWLS